MIKLDRSRGGFIITRSGLPFYLETPEVNDFRIEDIAASLARTGRYNGHLTYPDDLDLVYSVAQHSVYVHNYVEVMHPGMEAGAWALMHDGAEAYYGDMVSPLKRIIPAYGVLEDNAADVMCEAFDIDRSPVIDRIVKHADYLVYVAEARLMAPHNTDDSFNDFWDIPDSVGDMNMDMLDDDFSVWTPTRARDEFLAVFDTILNR